MMENAAALRIEGGLEGKDSRRIVSQPAWLAAGERYKPKFAVHAAAATDDSQGVSVGRPCGVTEERVRAIAGHDGFEVGSVGGGGCQDIVSFRLAKDERKARAVRRPNGVDGPLEHRCDLSPQCRDTAD